MEAARGQSFVPASFPVSFVCVVRLFLSPHPLKRVGMRQNILVEIFYFYLFRDILPDGIFHAVRVFFYGCFQARQEIRELSRLEKAQRKIRVCLSPVLIGGRSMKEGNAEWPLRRLCSLLTTRLRKSGHRRVSGCFVCICHNKPSLLPYARFPT